MLIPRDEGASFVHFMAAVAKVDGVEIGDAKKIVLHSKTWEDSRRAYDQFVDSLIELVDDIQEIEEDTTADISLSCQM